MGKLNRMLLEEMLDLNTALQLLTADVGQLETVPQSSDDPPYRGDEQLSADIHSARLLAYMFAVRVVVAHLGAQGIAIRGLAVLVHLEEALASAAMGTGKSYKKLRPARVFPNTPEISDVSVRAKIIALAQLNEDNAERMKELITAASGLTGQRSSVIQNWVYNARSGSLTNPVLLRLVSVWKEIYRRQDLQGRSMHDLLQV
jgi:hypothetical protein